MENDDKPDIWTLRTYKVILAIPVADRFPGMSNVQEVDGERVMPVEVDPATKKPIVRFISLSYPPEKLRSVGSGLSDKAKAEVLERARTVFLRDNPDEEGIELRLLDVQWLREKPIENTLVPR